MTGKGAASAALAANAPPLAGALQAGSGDLRFLGLSIYQARLWVHPLFEASDFGARPLALELIYQRAFSAEAIAKRSIAEMRRVGEFTEAQSKAWLAFMNQAFPNVGAQDRLTGVHDGTGGVRFYFNGKLSAATQDKTYARLFFGIWLSPKTSAPGLRNALIGKA